MTKDVLQKMHEKRMYYKKCMAKMYDKRCMEKECIFYGVWALEHAQSPSSVFRKDTFPVIWRLSLLQGQLKSWINWIWELL